MEPTSGFEPLTYSLPWSCSASELRGQMVLREGWSRRDAKNIAFVFKLLQYFGARPLVNLTVDGFKIPYQYQLFTSASGTQAAGAEGGIRTPEGIEPSDLQSDAFDHFATSA